MLLLVIILAVLVAVLWRQVGDLRARVDLLEFAGVPEARPSWREPPSFVRATVPQPEPFIAPEPEPEMVPPAPLPEPEGTQLAVIVPTPERGSGFEDVFGRKLPIWAGGVTLAVAGFLIVKYSIEAGLLSPLVRVVMGLVFGSGLIAGAEAALRRDDAVRDPRVRQALSGAGVATLYATVLAAANLYGLVGPGAAFAGMALVTALAGALSVRFGAPSAVLGLVGGLAAPALVGSAQPDVPLLTLYLALAVGGLCALGRQQRWWWLGAAALAGGFGWGAMLILGGALGFADALSVGLYTLALGVGLPLLLAGDRAATVRLVGGLAGCAQMAALVAVGGFAPLHWGLFALISIAIVWLSRREAVFADVPLLALGVAVLLGLAWPNPGAVELALLLAAMAVIHAVPAAWRVWRDDARASDAPTAAAVAVATGVLPLLHFPAADTAMTAVLGAVLAAGVAALGWRTPSRRDDARFATLAITAAVLLALAGGQALIATAWAPIGALLTLALYLLGERAEDARVERGAWAFALATLVLLVADDGLARLWGAAAQGHPATWAVPAALAAILAWRAGSRLALALQPAAVLVGYGAAAQLVPIDWLPLVPALAVAGLGATRRSAILPAAATAALVAAAWAAEPLAQWLAQAAVSLTGLLVTVDTWPSPFEATLRLAVPALALLLAATRLPLPKPVRHGALVAAAVALTLAAHIGYKQLFAIDGPARFVAHAMAERTLWEALLAAAAVAVWMRGARRVAIGLAAASVLHFAWFTGVVANPLLVGQQPGPWLILAYAVAGALVWSARRALPALSRQRGWALMALLVAGAFTLLRQAMHAPMVLAAGTNEGEQIARSILAIALAGGFLWTGIAVRSRDWRIASLALMLAAVVKVFLFDAAGLDGLARIASFAALGFSLIGVGWLYSRYLPDEAR